MAKAKEDNLHIRIDDDLKERLKEAADKKGLAISQLIRLLIIEYLEHTNKQ